MTTYIKYVKYDIYWITTQVTSENFHQMRTHTHSHTHARTHTHIRTPTHTNTQTHPHTRGYDEGRVTSTRPKTEILKSRLATQFTILGDHTAFFWEFSSGALLWWKQDYDYTPRNRNPQKSAGYLMYYIKWLHCWLLRISIRCARTHTHTHTHMHICTPTHTNTYTHPHTRG